jgi:hypothetical protein
MVLSNKKSTVTTHVNSLKEWNMISFITLCQIPDLLSIHVYCIFLSSRSIYYYFLDQIIALSRSIPRFYRNAVCEHVRTRPSFLKTRGVRTHLSLRTKIICCVRIISSSHALRSVPSDRFNKEIVNRKSKITLTISLRARICAFH